MSGAVASQYGNWNGNVRMTCPNAGRGEVMEITFNNVTITMDAQSPIAAYAELCVAIGLTRADMKVESYSTFVDHYRHVDPVHDLRIDEETNPASELQIDAAYIATLPAKHKNECDECLTRGYLWMSTDTSEPPHIEKCDACGYYETDDDAALAAMNDVREPRGEEI